LVSGAQNSNKYQKYILTDKAKIANLNSGNVSGHSAKAAPNEHFVVQPTKREKEYLDIYSFKQKLNKTINMNKNFNVHSFGDTTVNQ